MEKERDILEEIYNELLKWTAVTDDDHRLKERILKTMGIKYDRKIQNRSGITILGFPIEEEK